MLSRALVVLLLVGLTAGCGRQAVDPSASGRSPHAGLGGDALHCYLVLTLTLDQLAEFEGARSREARRQSEELHRARARHAAALDPDLLDELRRDPWPSLHRVLAEFDEDGDGELGSAAEVAEFNRHVGACL
jgi:hypothetical protein